MPTHLDRSSLTVLDSLSCRLITSAVRCRLATRVTLRQLPSLGSFVQLLSRSLTRSRQDRGLRPLFGFAPKQTKGSSACRTTYIVLQVFYPKKKKKRKRLHITAYTEKVGFGHFGDEGLWKKFNRKFQFLWRLVYRIVKTSHRRNEIFDIRNRVFSSAEGRLSVDWNEQEKKMKRILNSYTERGYFVDKLFHFTFCWVTIQRWVSLLLVPILPFTYNILCYFYLLYYLFYVYYLFVLKWELSV